MRSTRACKAAAQALERLGVSTRADEPEVADAAFERWRVYQKGRQFVATNDEFPRLKINLEMMGKGQPRILEWDVKKPPFAGIAVLRFHAGVVEGPRGPEEVEHAAIIDLQTNAVVAVVVQRQGDKVAQWTWDDGKLVVASADGLTDEFQLRQGKPPPPPPVVAQKRPADHVAQAQDAVRAAVRRVLGRSPPRPEARRTGRFNTRLSSGWRRKAFLCIEYCARGQLQANIRPRQRWAGGG